jgi:hypothetical protein
MRPLKALLSFPSLLWMASLGAAQVGGVSMDAEGVLRFDARARRGAPAAAEASADVAARSDLRRISLRRLDQEVRAALHDEGGIPDELRFLAGLTELNYVVVDPARRDVLLAGPAEGWKIDSSGRPIGATANRAVLQLEDLALALRVVLKGSGRIECSIDPTREGLEAVQARIAAPWDSRREGPRRRDEVREALGRQVVSVTGVPAGSRFGRTIVEADYLMKQIAIGSVRLPRVSNHLDALVDAAKRGEAAVQLTRWWFTADYAPPATDESGRVWRLRGRRIQLLNEEMLLDAQGNREGKGAASRRDRFSREFTEALPDVETKYAVFSDLRNLYDLVFAAAVIRKLDAGGWLEGTVFLDSEALPTPEGIAPRFAENVAAYAIHRGRDASGAAGTVLTIAFGGVSIDAGRMVGGPAGPSDAAPGLARLSAPLDSAPEASPEDESQQPDGSSAKWWSDQAP